MTTDQHTAEEVAAWEEDQRLAWAAEDRELELAAPAWPDDLVPELAAAALERRRTNAQRGFVRGGDFALNQPEQLPVIWGSEDAPLAVEGEGFMIAGIQGVGKTTIGQQFALALTGQRDEVLGMPVTPTGRVLYLALDRPAQISRSLAGWSPTRTASF